MSGYDRAVFFRSVRAAFGDLMQSQVDGFNAILVEAERRQIDKRWLAYMLATAWHETAKHMQPVIETRQPNEATNPSVDEAIRRLEAAWKAGKMRWVNTAYWRKDASGLSWLGRGLPQTTHRANYLKLEKATGIPLTKDPSLALAPAHAVTIMFAGMIDGLYTGKKLADYFNARTPDLNSAWRSARQIINGLEKADVVAGYAAKFFGALVPAAAPAIAGRPTPSPSTPIVATAINPPPPVVEQTSKGKPMEGFFLGLLKQQWQGIVRGALWSIGGALATKGLVSPDSWAGFSPVLETAIGAVVTAGTTAWSLHSNKASTIISTASKLQANGRR